MPEAPDAWSDLVELVELSRPSPAGTFAPAPSPPPRQHRLRRLAVRVLLLAVLPALIAAGYLYGFAADRYASEARFVVRKANALGRPAGGSLLPDEGAKGLGSDDSYAVRDFLLSRDALRLAIDQGGFRTVLGRSGGDPFWSFPGRLTGRTDEQLYKLYQSMVTIDYDSGSGVTTLKVQGFRPEDARDTAVVLMQGAENLLNRLNERARADSLRVAEGEVARSRAQARAAEQQLTDFRNREAVIDPTLLAKTVLDTIAALSLQSVETVAQIDIARQASPNSPQIAPLSARLRALRAQMQQERASLAGGDRSFAPRIAEYEQLVLERDFAERSLLSAMAVLEAGRMDALRQQAYLERVVEPRAADEALYPHRPRWIAGIFAAGLALVWLFRPTTAGAPAHPRA